MLQQAYAKLVFVTGMGMYDVFLGRGSATQPLACAGISRACGAVERAVRLHERGTCMAFSSSSGQHRRQRLYWPSMRALPGEARWDVRMTAWLLWVASELPDSPLWAAYIATLPPADEVGTYGDVGPWGVGGSGLKRFKPSVDAAMQGVVPGLATVVGRGL